MYEAEATRDRAAYERAKQEGERAKAEAKAASEAKAEEPPRAQSGAKRKAPAEKALVDRSWEETCPEFGDGWTRRSRQRAGASGVDHTYVSPAGKSFPSRVKVVQHLGLASDPGSQGGRRLTEEERAARLGAKLPKEKEKASQQGAHQRAVTGDAKAAASPAAPPTALPAGGGGRADDEPVAGAAVAALLVPGGSSGRAHSASLRGALACLRGPPRAPSPPRTSALTPPPP